jgi:hypothetical protein
VARHRETVPPFLYVPTKRPLRGVGEVLGAFPLPGDPTAGPMHAMRRLQWKTWARLAFVKAGGDWRSLEELRVADGHLTDFGLVPETEWHRGTLGVCPWDAPSGTITGAAMPTTGPFSVADPRVPDGYGEYAQLGVIPWAEPSGTVSGQSAVGGGRYAVADPRLPPNPDRYLNHSRVERWEDPVHTVTGATRPGSGGLSVADPRLRGAGPAFNNVFRVVRWADPSPSVTGPGGPSGLAVADPRPDTEWRGKGKYRVTRFEDPAGTVIAASTTGNGAFAVADPRTNLGDAGWPSAGGAYGVIPWEAPAGAVTGKAGHDHGRFSVADPRLYRNAPSSEVEKLHTLPAADARLVAVIRALDGTWHRPFTTLELAALQGLVEPGEDFLLDGASDSAWREHIGNAVPSPAATAIAEVMGQTLLLAWAGETFVLSAAPIWVRPLAIAISVDLPEGA